MSAMFPSHPAREIGGRGGGGGLAGWRAGVVKWL